MTMMKKTAIYMTALAVALAAAGCSSKSEGGVSESAQQIEQAHNAGREAARKFVSQQWNDTLALQQQLVEAASARAPYDSLPKCRAAYDSAFISTIRTVSPDVARELERYRDRQ